MPERGEKLEEGKEGLVGKEGAATVYGGGISIAFLERERKLYIKKY